MKNTMQDKEQGKNQFALLNTKRFGPFFWTQFFGAFNDNVFKNALLILLAYQSASMVDIDSNTLMNIAAGLFILPFFLFSATAGQIADKYEKSMLIRRIKFMEIIIMLCAAGAFYLKNIYMLLFLLFLMGTQSTFFGPLKYSIIPQHLKKDEIVGGNALVSMGTFISILLGTMAGGILIQHGDYAVGFIVCAIALAGWLVSIKIPKACSLSPEIKLDFNPFTQIWKTVGYARYLHSVFLSVLGISWFWFLGSAYLTQIPNFTKLVLKGNESVVTLLLTMFSIGIGAGSLFCEKLSGRKVELGLVPLGSIGLSIFGIDLFLAYDPPEIKTLMGISAFMQTPGSFRVLADLVLIGIFGGFYIVPLNAFIQTRTRAEYRARVIAANNILNSLFMVLSALTGIVLLGIMKIGIPKFFLVVAILNALVAVYIYTVVPEFTMRFLIWILTHTMYRVKHKGLENIPDEGPAVLVCNHVSFVDGLIIAGACRRPIRFVMFEPIYRLPILNFIFRTGKAIPITSQKTDPETFNKAFEMISQTLEEGELICIFPEGKLTTDGEIDIFKPGIERVIKQNPVQVVPLALRGLWGSFFSRKYGASMKKPFKRFCSKIELFAGEPVMPEAVTAGKLQKIVQELRGDRC
ncbi:MFS transporter, phospholipid/glycerol acyltransferase domain-containing [Desulfonema limicola]|uniref:MFS transporter, phospholipid/glycerol acyltransferase domain-containing n=1 Tax=Desulfonema limicola TaxID=45656 RepID=A0A975GEM4_9BACT|nr:MFS transporter [Desulfonema limicola]QTA78285.1 MFS transporter, phospholipid/glycerol acyltransferase domain-containing [Desulfonema limicola]